jgi:hypothetical protein
MPRIDVPPPGRAMAFSKWSAAIVAGVRRYLPGARAARRGHRHVIIRHGDREAHLREDASFWITFSAPSAASTMGSMFDDRRDAFTVGNLAHSIAGYFDARFTRA